MYIRTQGASHVFLRNRKARLFVMNPQDRAGESNRVAWLLPPISRRHGGCSLAHAGSVLQPRSKHNLHPSADPNIGKVE
jgi:hypothetical protein